MVLDIRVLDNNFSTNDLSNDVYNEGLEEIWFIALSWKDTFLLQNQVWTTLVWIQEYEKNYQILISSPFSKQLSKQNF